MNDVITVAAWTCDVDTELASADDYTESIVSFVEASWDSGADLVLFPEYTWAGLEILLPAHAGLAGVADAFWHRLLPQFHQRLSRPGKAVVLGTAPCIENGQMFNRAPMIVEGRLLTQDKLFLTPWEHAFSRGKVLRTFEFKGLRIAVVICLDIEIPELSVRLRGQGVDLILVPSATETELGCERVTRCASARAVELGCYVIVSPLVGRCTSELVDENLGKLACYAPSQAPFTEAARLQESEILTMGFHTLRFPLAHDLLKKARQMKAETNPSLLDLGPEVPPVKPV